jgi:hypothetical protein
MAKKMAFAVASSASNRGMVVKNPGWFNQIESSVYRQIIADLQGIMLININKQINKDLKGNK